ncbi:hypothetical protein [Actibacterium sp. 188UL27-1]|uniref:hypothetical protein n=1 Tax=Actibacterium sp. 188UL27-1 TaxID=2786961 RepID=UPI00195A93E0|nr:hypothetical protein [Actibacterium sp. 188UL27-1]MBM7069725.1 hypothetical protein [Actibacterium sp. 188UL27-1]
MQKSVLGIVILGAVAGVTAAVSLLDLGGLTRSVDRRDPITVSIYYGGEKSALLRNEKVQEILERRYKITLDATKAGSVEMATSLPVAGRDCLWPSNMVAVELARENGRTILGSETIFNSPIVFYAWADVADAMISKGVVTKRNDDFLTADVAKIGELIATEARWKEDLGLNIYGPFKVFSTHPAKSNSGNIWSGLLATVLNKGRTPTEDDLDMLVPQVNAYFAAMGHMEASSGDIFQNFLKQGMGARPIIVGYENQMVEFLAQNARFAEDISTRVRVIYPEPTIFASHPLISLTSKCKRLSEALIDLDLQAAAWADHGFRTGLIGVENDPNDIAETSLPETVNLVVPMPSANVMEAIIEAVE